MCKKSATRETPSVLLELAAFIDYDPVEGLLTWCAAVGTRRDLVGVEVGSLRPDGYRHFGFRGRQFLSHRVAWALFYGTWPDDLIDHEGRCRANNRIANLRHSTYSLNAQNKNEIGRPRTRSVAEGVYPSGQKFCAHISACGVQHYLGSFGSAAEATAVRNAAAARLHPHTNHSDSSRVPA